MLFCKGIAKKSLNPFNIKYDKSNNWLGQKGQYKGFVQFESQGYGIRAGIKLLYRYVFEFKLLDIQEIISRFCPRSVDGNSATFDDYVSFVCSKVGVNDIRTHQGFAILCKSIAFYECQIQIPDSQIYFCFDILHLCFTNKKF